MNDNPATKQDLTDLRIDMQEDLAALEERLIEHMRGMQTELLRGFASFSAGQTIRMRKLEADQSNLSYALSGRIEVLEERLLEIEQRLHIVPPGETA